MSPGVLAAEPPMIVSPYLHYNLIQNSTKPTKKTEASYPHMIRTLRTTGSNAPSIQNKRQDAARSIYSLVGLFLSHSRNTNCTRHKDCRGMRGHPHISQPLLLMHLSAPTNNTQHSDHDSQDCMGLFPVSASGWMLDRKAPSLSALPDCGLSLCGWCCPDGSFWDRGGVLALGGPWAGALPVEGASLEARLKSSTLQARCLHTVSTRQTGVTCKRPVTSQHICNDMGQVVQPTPKERSQRLLFLKI